MYMGMDACTVYTLGNEHCEGALCSQSENDN